MKKFFNILIIVFSLSFKNFAIANEEYELTQNDIDEIYEFATNASMGIIFHEIGHLIVDEFNVPIFNNEEDVADSFMAWSLIQIPDEYASYEDYEYYAEEPHKVIKGISDYYYYLTLLGRDTSEVYGKDSEYAIHSTDNKRFFNIACFMKGSNPEVFNTYITKRGFDYILEDQCDYNYWQMSDAWWDVFKGSAQGEEYEFWEVYVENYVQKIFLDFQDTNVNIHQYFEEYAKPTILYFLQNVIAQVKLEEDYILSFEYCGGDINAYYISTQNKILFCYELVEEFMNVKTDIIFLKNSL